MREKKKALFWKLLLLVLLFSPSVFSAVTPIWKAEYSSVELSSSDGTTTVAYTSYATFDTYIARTYKSGGKNYIEIENSSTSTKTAYEYNYGGVDSIVKIKNNLYICSNQVGETPLLRIKNQASTIEAITTFPETITNNRQEITEWSLSCLTRTFNNSPTNKIIVAFIGTPVIYAYSENGDDDKWSDNIIYYQKKFVYFSADTVQNHNGNNTLYYTYVYYLEAGMYHKFSVLKMEYESSTLKISANDVGKKTVCEGSILTNVKACIKKKSTFDFDIYIVTWDDTKLVYYKSQSTVNSDGASLGDFKIDKTEYSLPIDVGESFKYTDFNFLVDSTYYYYRLETSSGKKYWGIGDIVTDKIFFHTSDSVDQLGTFSNSPTSVLALNNDKSYFVCALDFGKTSNPPTCSECASGQVLLLNSADHNVCVSGGTSGIITENGYAKCEEGKFFKTDTSSCVTCAEGGKYILDPEGTCSDCDESIRAKSETDHKCILCSSKNQFLLNGACVEGKADTDPVERPDGTYFTNEEYNVLESCDSSCFTCSDATSCDSCKGDYYLSPTEKKCLDKDTKPEGYYGKYTNPDDNTNSWINCATKSLYRLEDGDTCIEKPTNTFAVPISETGGEDYGVLRTCHDNCETCNEKGDDTDNKCIKCVADKYLLDKLCTTDCDNNNKYFKDSTERKCVNCWDSKKFRYIDGECLETQPEGTKVVDEDFGIIEDCYSTCSECELPKSDSSVSESAQHCLSCKQSLSTKYVDASKNCVDTCTDYYYQNDQLKKCEQCQDPAIKEKGASKPCFTPDSSTSPYYFIEEALRVIGYCEDKCAKCKKGDADDKSICEKCDSSSFMLYGSTECADACGDDKLYANPNTRKCEKCSDDSKFKYIGEDQSCQEESAFTTPHYLKDSGYGIIENCGSSCKSCSEPGDAQGDHCTDCEDSKVLSYEVHTCIDTCGELYYLDGKECKSCKDNKDGNQYKERTSNVCIQMPTTKPFYYVNEDLKVIDYCYNTCKTCEEGPSNDNKVHGCKTCIDGLTLVGKNCIDSCPNTKHGIYNGVCQNCAETSNKYKYEGENNCISTPDGPFYSIDSSFGIIGRCRDHCTACEKDASLPDDSTAHLCTQCESNYYLSEGKCVDSCPSNYGILNGECVKCSEKGKYYKKENEDNCQLIDDIESSGYYVSDSTYNIIKPCDTHCTKCTKDTTTPDDPATHVCTDCESNYFISSGKCKGGCEENYGVHDGACVNCKLKNLYKKDDGTDCESMPATGYFVSDESFNIISPCVSNCDQCQKDTTAQNQPKANKCSQCTEGFLLNESDGTCSSTCPNGYGLLDKKCVNCQEKGMYKKDTSDSCESIADIATSGYYVSDSSFNIIKKCNDNCSACLKDDTQPNDPEAHKCTACKAGNHLSNDQCLSGCQTNYGLLDGECVNCKEKTKYKKEGVNQCEDMPTNGYYISNSDFNIISPCDSNCYNCENSANNCIECTGDLFLEYGGSSCVSSCGTDNKLVAADHKCINCKKESKFKILENNECIVPTSAQKYVVKDEDYNIIEMCYDSCEKCFGKGDSQDNNCEVCKSGYIQDTVNTKNCNEACVKPNKWYYDSAGKQVCLQSNQDCPTDKPLFVGDSYQCVASCSPSDCEICGKEPNVLYYKNDKACVKKCPADKEGNKQTYTCDKKKEDKGCTQEIRVRAARTASGGNLKTEINEGISEYIQSSTSDVLLIELSNAKYYIYKNDTCGYNISMKEDLTYTNLTKCISKLMEDGIVSDPKKIIITQIDINRDSVLTNQAGYYITTEDGTQISLAACSEIKVEKVFPINVEDLTNYQKGRKLSSMGVDIYNPEDSFFNDFCYAYYDDNGNDVILQDRRRDYFSNNSLCESGCEYYSIDFKTARVKCECEAKEDSFSKIVENVPMIDFPDGLSMSNLVVVRCYNLVFNWKYLKVNLGGWIMLALFIIQIPIIIVGLIIGFRPIYSYLNQFCKETNDKNDKNPQANPPKKNDDSVLEEASKEEEEDEEDKEDEDEEEEGEEEEEGQSSNANESSSHESSSQEESRSNDAKKVKSSKKDKSKVVTRKKVSFDSPQMTKSMRETADSLQPALKKPRAKPSNLNLNSAKTNNNFVSTQMTNPKVYKKYGYDVYEKRKGSDFSSGDPVNSPKEKEEEFSDDELDELAVEDAVEYDKRCICKFYCHLLKKNLPFLSICTNISPLEPVWIKVICLILNIALFIVLNAMLFDTNYISKKYISGGKDSFKLLLQNEIPKCVYASIVTFIIGILVNYVTSSRKRLETEIKKELEGKEFLVKTRKILKDYKIRVFVFLIIDIILMGFFWYYVDAFCSVYQKSQEDLLISSLITFVFCIVLYMFLYLLVTIFRYIGLKCKVTCFYTLSSYFI